MQVIITKIGCRIGQSRKIMRNVLVRTGVREPSRVRNRTNNKINRGLVTTAAKQSTLWGCVAEGEVYLTFDVLLKGPVRRPLPSSSRSSGLLPMTLLPVYGSRGMRAIKIRPVMTAILVAVGAPVAKGTTSVTAKTGAVLLLGKMSRRQ
jgi:hypothetical protein